MVYYLPKSATVSTSNSSERKRNMIPLNYLSREMETGLTANSIPIINSNGNLQQSSEFTYNLSTQRLGIGTSSPSYHLTIQADSATVTDAAFLNSSGSPALVLDYENDDLTFGILDSEGTTTHKFRSARSTGGISFILNPLTIGEALDTTTHALLNINSTRDHTSDSSSTVNYAQTIRRKSNTTGHEVALGIAVNNDNTTVGAYIALERTGSNSIGKIHIGNKITSGAAPVNIITIDTSFVGINQTSPVAPIDAKLRTQANDAPLAQFSVENANTVDDPLMKWFGFDKTTTNGSAQSVCQITIPASTTVLVKGWAVARRTGGSAGAAEDGAAYEFAAIWKNVAGTATAIGSPTITALAEDQAGWDLTTTQTTDKGILRVTGAANNNISWEIFYMMFRIGS